MLCHSLQVSVQISRQMNDKAPIFGRVIWVRLVIKLTLYDQQIIRNFIVYRSSR